jgi:predicted DNA binding CopG/RHH family protein
MKLTKQEKAIEKALVKGEYVSAGKAKLEKMAQAIAARRKDAVLNIRLNGTDLKNIKNKAERLGVKYQTFISEVLHRVAGAR